jgi:hypothetical protein
MRGDRWEAADPNPAARRACPAASNPLGGFLTQLACAAGGWQSEDARLLQEFLDQDTTCQLCGMKDTGDDASKAVVALEGCDHRVCSGCTYSAINTKGAGSQRDYVCPAPGCARPMAQREVKRLLSPADFEKFVDLELADLHEQQGADAGAALVKCPKGCGWAVMVDAQSPAGTPTGKTLNSPALMTP